MPAPAPDTIPLRIIVEEPVDDLAIALQKGSDKLERPAAVSRDRMVFDLTVRVGAPQANGMPNFLGSYTQGPAAGRFVYLCVGRRAGQSASPWDGRIKVPLTGITTSQVKAVQADSTRRLAVRFPGRNPKGGPALATVRLGADPWALVADR